MKHTSSTELRANLAAMMDRVNDDHEPLMVTRAKGRPVVMISLEDYAAMDETAYLLSSPANAKALRDAMARLGGDAKKINPMIPADLVIDHSVQVDAFGSVAAIFKNTEREFERNQERYQFLRCGQEAFDNFRVVPPCTGIVHQVNLG